MWLTEVFPTKSKITTIKDIKVIYSNSSLKLWKERKYAIEQILMKSYKNFLVFLVARSLKDNVNPNPCSFTIVYPISIQCLTLFQWIPVFRSHQRFYEILFPHNQMEKELIKPLWATKNNLLKNVYLGIWLRFWFYLW